MRLQIPKTNKITSITLPPLFQDYLVTNTRVDGNQLIITYLVVNTLQEITLDLTDITTNE